MDVALGFKAHSGWAALVVIGKQGDALAVVDRRRIELADAEDGPWAKQPYHAAEGQPFATARATVKRGIATAERLALREIRAAVTRAREAQHDVRACAVLVGEPMPDWSVDEILAVHFRMHKAEGVLYKDVLLRASSTCAIRVVPVSEKRLVDEAQSALAGRLTQVVEQIARGGKTVGAPWGKDQKDAALAAAIALAR